MGIYFYFIHPSIISFDGHRILFEPWDPKGRHLSVNPSPTLSESKPTPSTSGCALDWKECKRSLFEASVSSVDLPGFSFAPLKEDVLVKRIFQACRLLVKISSSSTSMSANEKSKPSTLPNAKESLENQERLNHLLRFMPFPLWVNLQPQASQQQVEMEVRFLLREMQSLGLLNCIRDWKIERWPNGYGWHRSSGSSIGFSLNPCETSVGGRARKSSIPTLLPVKSSKKHLNLSESKPSTSTCACAPDWKEWEFPLFPNVCFQSICGFA